MTKHQCGSKDRVRGRCLRFPQIGFQILACITRLDFGDLFRGAGADDVAAAGAAFGADIDEVVGGFDDL